jgi:Protein of unknown function (DUF3363)
VGLDLVSASDRLAKELNLKGWQSMEGENISGTYLRPVTLASGKFAVVEKSKEFTLVPWRPEMEQFRGKTLYGTASGLGINWDWNAGRGRGLGVS